MIYMIFSEYHNISYNKHHPILFPAINRQLIVIIHNYLNIKTVKYNYSYYMETKPHPGSIDIQ